jgi:hypothetical protein
VQVTTRQFVFVSNCVYPLIPRATGKSLCGMAVVNEVGAEQFGRSCRGGFVRSPYFEDMERSAFEKMATRERSGFAEGEKLVATGPLSIESLCRPSGSPFKFFPRTRRSSSDFHDSLDFLVLSDQAKRT